ncbi:endonuclease I family protein [Actinophytocola sp.]|uniref:endonuclease I family protein n=1 Tax=Actinophytocola sp. TaxID=1872138 RepID=UPI003D6B2200
MRALSKASVLTAAGVLLAVVGVAVPPLAMSASAPDIRLPAEIPPGYYDAAEGKTGPELHAALHGIIGNGAHLTYDEVWDALKVTDEDPASPANVLMIYSGASMPEDANGGDADQWNREHTWAKSHGDFGTSPGPGTDLFHLRPCEVGVNSTRGNLDFDLGGEEVPEAPDNFVDEDSFEPRDAVKGDVARGIFYMAVRYDGEDGFADLEPNDSVGNNDQPFIGRLSVLLAWHAQDPPDAAEQTRNDIIFEQFQQNRNPFIDRPEFADAIW